jgi:CRISPR-associated protein Cas1
MNPLHLSGFGVEIQASNAKPHAELMITDGRRDNNIGERYLFLPRSIEYDSIILENCTGRISLAALRWLSKHNIPVFFLDFDGSTISSILPPTSVKADLRAAQFQAANDPKRKLTIARAIVDAKIRRSLCVLEWLSDRYDIERDVQAAKHEALKLSKVSTVSQIRTVEGRVALHYWEGFAKVMPEPLHFHGRVTASHNNNASDPFNAAVNYGYGFLKIQCRKAVNTVGLEPAVGFLHELSHYQTSESLVYDIEEPFRFLVDLCVIQAFETQELTPQDFAFRRDDYLYRIQWEGKMRFLNILRETFNSGVNYKGRTLKWDTVIQEKTNELARYLSGESYSISFDEPSPIIERVNSREVRERILSLTEKQAGELGIGKSTLHYLRKRARDSEPFKIYGKVKEKLESA